MPIISLISFLRYTAKRKTFQIKYYRMIQKQINKKITALPIEKKKINFNFKVLRFLDLIYK